MQLHDWLSLANLVSPLAVAVLVYFHKQNALRWTEVLSEIHKLKKRHRKTGIRLDRLETQLVMQYTGAFVNPAMPPKSPAKGKQ